MRRAERRKSLREKLRHELHARLPALRATPLPNATKLAPVKPAARRGNRVILGLDSNDRPFPTKAGSATRT